MRYEKSGRKSTKSVTDLGTPDEGKYEFGAHIGSADIDSALHTAGWCHCLPGCVLAACCLANCSTSLDMSSVALALPAAECDLQMTSAEKGALNSLIFVGMLAGSLAWGVASDVAGRRRALGVSLLLMCCGTAASAVAPSLSIFLCLRLLSGFGSGASMPVVFAYLAEWQTQGRRSIAISALSSFWMIGGILAAAGAWLLLPRTQPVLVLLGVRLQLWRLFLLACSCPGATAALAFWLLPESPRHLVQSGKHGKAAALLNKMAETQYRGDNGVEVFSDNSTAAVEVQDVEKSNNNNNNNHNNNNNSMKQLFQNVCLLLSRQHRKRVLLLVTCQSCLAMSYYGLLLWFPILFKRAEQHNAGVCAGGLVGNATVKKFSDMCDEQLLKSSRPYFESFAANLSSLPGNFASVLLINAIGSRRVLIGSLALTAASVLLVAVVKTQSQALVVSCCFVGVGSAAWNSVNIVGVSLMPTRLRASALGLSSSCSRVASMLGTLGLGILIDSGCVLPLTLLAAFMLAGSLAACFLPRD